MKPLDLLGFGPTRRTEENIDGTYTVYVKPPKMFNIPEEHIVLTRDQYSRYLRWLDGELMIQEALPDLNVDQREILLSGLNDDNFKKMAGPEDD